MPRRSTDIDLAWQQRNDVPAPMVALAEKRTKFLFGVLRAFPELQFKALLQSAYIQGMEDALDAMTDKGAPLR